MKQAGGLTQTSGLFISERTEEMPWATESRDDKRLMDLRARCNANGCVVYCDESDELLLLNVDVAVAPPKPTPAINART